MYYSSGEHFNKRFSNIIEIVSSITWETQYHIYMSVLIQFINTRMSIKIPRKFFFNLAI